jgi:hypothetical protein
MSRAIVVLLGVALRVPNLIIARCQSRTHFFSVLHKLTWAIKSLR